MYEKIDFFLFQHLVTLVGRDRSLVLQFIRYLLLLFRLIGVVVVVLRKLLENGYDAMGANDP